MLPHLRNLYQSVKQRIKLIGPAAGKAKNLGKRIVHKIVNYFADFDIRKAVDAINTKAVFATAGVIAVTMAVMLFYGLGFRFGYHVYMGNDFLASVSDKSVLQKSMDNINDILGYEYNYNDEPSARFAIIRSSEKDITSDIINRLSDIAQGLILTVDGNRITTFASSKDAVTALNEVLKEAKANGSITAEFADNLDFKQAYVKKSTITDVDSAVSYLTSYHIEPKIYTIGNGETLKSVSDKYKITTEELLNRNPALTEEDFKPGAEVVINCPKRVLSVKSDFKTNRMQDVPYDIKKVDDPNIYEGMTSIKSAGTNGTKEVKEVSTEIDGIRVACNVTEETIIKQPVAQVEAVGTKAPAEGTITGHFSRPASGVVTSRYGTRWGRVHKGVDLGAKYGDPIQAADGGIVVFAGDSNDGYGLKVIIDHGSEYETLYGHCSELLVKEGMNVEKGDIIGKVGSTGDSTGPHLHFEVRIHGESVDPLPFLDEK